MEQSVPKRRNIKFRHRAITQYKEYNIRNMAKFWHHKCIFDSYGYWVTVKQCVNIIAAHHMRSRG